jgi:hypothetical protein
MKLLVNMTMPRTLAESPASPPLTLRRVSRPPPRVSQLVSIQFVSVSLFSQSARVRTNMFLAEATWRTLQNLVLLPMT